MADPDVVPIRGGSGRGKAGARSGADALAAGAARASGERARRRRTPLLSDPGAGERAAGGRAAGGRAAGDRETPPAPPASSPATPAGTPVGGSAQDPLTAHRPRPAPRATTVRLGKAASAERSETRSPRTRRARTAGGAGESAPALTAVASPPPESAATPPATAGGPRVSGLEELVHVAVSVLRLAAEASGLSGQDVERQVADTLAFLRRRLTGVWPEGIKGVGTPFSERNKLQRFGRGGFVAAALRTG